MKAGAAQWARAEFGRACLGDVRRTRRLLAMAAMASRRPSGMVSAVFDRASEREGAYDFLESPLVKPDAVAESIFAATAARARGEERVFVAIDGSSLALTDENGAKGFGTIGSPNRLVRGLMVMNALAVTSEGVPLGLIDQIFWNREPAETGLAPGDRAERNRNRLFDDKETSYLIDAARNAMKRLEPVGATPWVVIDREGDNRDILLRLHQEGFLFTIRGRWDRRLYASSESLHEALDAEPSLGTYEIHVARSGRRAARTAVVDVRASQVTLHFVGRGVYPEDALRLYAVRIREESDERDALDWLLYTNVPVFSADHARKILQSYQARWRVEEFHRTWKQGECNVEDAQLRSMDAVIKWSTILAAVATRIERLKYLSRNQPDQPATIEFGADEIDALRLDHQRRTGRRKRAPTTPTILEATQWAAQLGGWTGTRSGPPGSITLARGLERLAYLVEGMALERRRKARHRTGRPS
jgi:hypothetical protein